MLLPPGNSGTTPPKIRDGLTLDPVPHLDLFGSLIFLVCLLWRQSDIIFGWAKPVPVNAEKFANPRKDQMVVSFAGPAANLLVAMCCFLLLGFVMLFSRLLWPEALAVNLAPLRLLSRLLARLSRQGLVCYGLSEQLLFTSLALGCFNLIPIPPLDGSWILSGLLPQRARNWLSSSVRTVFFFFCCS